MFDNKNFDELNTIAMKLVLDNQWDNTAIEVNKRIIQEKLNHPAAHTRLAKCLLAKGDQQGAYKIYKTVLEFDPNNTIAWNFVKCKEFSVKKEIQKKEHEEITAKNLEEKQRKEKEIKRMISEI